MPIRDDSLVAQYIRAIENADSTGYKNGRWYQPDLPGYDVNNRGFGVDIVRNVNASTLTKNRQGKWLTGEEEREIRNGHIEDNIRALEAKAPSYILRNPPSEEKQAMAVGMLYRGDSVMQNSSVRDAYLSGSDDAMQNAVSDYYKSKNVSERAQRHNQFFNSNQSNAKKSNVPISIRKPTPYTPPSYKKEQFVPGKKYDDGGYLTHNWDSLSMQDKAEMIKVAIDNGITTLPEIRKAYNEFAKGGRMKWTMQDEAGYRYWRSRLPKNLRGTNDNDYDMRAAYRAGMEPQWNDEDKAYHLGSRDPQSGRILKAAHHPTFLKALLTDASLGYYPTTDKEGNTYTETWQGNNVYAKGGYKPSAKLQKDIATWEGSEMKRNRSFGEMTQQFNAVVPREVQARLQPKQLDALYSYGYNVGMGNLKERVLPMLNAYVNGKASNEDVQKSMWARKDSKLRGLARRRNWERDMFGGSCYAPFSKDVSKKGMRNYKVSDLRLSQQFYDGISDSIAIPQMQMPSGMDVDPTTLYKAPTVDDTLFTAPKVDKQEIVYNPQQDRLEGLRRYNTIMGMMGGEYSFWKSDW